jgi:hypothetical protein
MERTPPTPVELYEQIPPHIQAVLWVVFARPEDRKVEAAARFCHAFVHLYFAT